MKKRLLFVTTALNRGGAEVSLVNLLNSLDTAKFDIDLLITNQVESGAISLISKISSSIRVCNVVKEESKLSFFKKSIIQKRFRADKINEHSYSALNFIKNKIYDYAFSYGEWFSPAFVAEMVNAKIKATWIHNDLSKAEYFDANSFFHYHLFFDYYIFVSERSLKESINAYPFLENKSYIIHNMINDDEVIEASNEALTDFDFKAKPVVVTVANIRVQKNHLKAIDAFIELRNRGIDFKWINIGSLVDTGLVDKIRDRILKNDIQDDFILLGPRENPYKYMKHAYAIAVLSDYESWSLVITEAKVLNKIIISTKTSGAIEQIEQKKTGILTNFEVEDIVLQMETLFRDTKLQQRIINNLKGFTTKNTTIIELEQLLARKSINNEDNSNKVLVVMDNINYNGGGHLAAKRLIKELVSKGNKVTIFSDSRPNYTVLNDLKDINFITFEQVKYNNMFNEKLLSVVTSHEYNRMDKLIKLKMTYKSKLKSSSISFSEFVMPAITKKFEEFSMVCVTSEGSSFRSLISRSKCKKKIQWIHTDYSRWSSFNDYTREATKDDEKIYKGFDKIIFVSENSRLGFVKKYPELDIKTKVIKNIMPEQQIRMLANQCPNNKHINIVTVGRLESEKAYDRIFRVSKRLASDGYNFIWRIIGDGSQNDYLVDLINKMNINDYVKILGGRQNPFPLVKEADIFALLSYYEGLPNTIYESLILGIPVVATNVGGISEQLEHGNTGWLLENNEEKIYEGLKYLFENEDVIFKIKENLKNYRYDNESICQTVNELFTLD